MGDRERARAILSDLRRLGIRVAVDDFGTGYSSLAYLRELPIDELKLDRSFVQPMGEDPRAAAIVRSTIELAHSLGMTMVAEGVEDGETAGQLALSSCDKIQGFYFSKALPSAELELWMDAREPLGVVAVRDGARRGSGPVTVTAAAGAADTAAWSAGVGRCAPSSPSRRGRAVLRATGGRRDRRRARCACREL